MKTPSLLRRMACWLYEGVLLFGVVFIAGYLFGTLSQTRNAMDNRTALQGFLFVVFGIYFVWFWSKGQTLAMKTWHIRLVSTQGQGVSQRRALLRYVLSWVWFVPPLALAYTIGMSARETALGAAIWVLLWALSSTVRPDRQFWHDIWAGTQLTSVDSAGSARSTAIA
jgi:uncharacterized RDD family membrane protein YckC